MDIQQAIIMFDALSQETRLRAFRLLVKAGPDGLAAGILSDRLKVPHNTMSFHLSHLSNAKLISSRKDGRSVIYSANFMATRDMVAFLIKDCCSGDFVSIRENKNTGGSTIEFVNRFKAQPKTH